VPDAERSVRFRPGSTDGGPDRREEAGPVRERSIIGPAFGFDRLNHRTQPDHRPTGEKR